MVLIFNQIYIPPSLFSSKPLGNRPIRSNCNYYYLLLWVIFTLALTDGFSLEFEWQQVSLSLQDFSSIISDLNNVVIWMVNTCPLISNLPFPIPIFGGLSQVHQPKGVSLSPSYFIDFFSVLKQRLSTHLSFHFLCVTL